MEILALIFAGVSAIAAAVSAFVAFSAKSEVKKLKVIISESTRRSVSGKNRVMVENKAENSGVIAGINTGDVNVGAKK